MAPPIVWVIVIGYLAIGLFLCGFFHDEPGTDIWLVFLWPVVIFGILLFYIIGLPFELGRKLSDFIKKLNNRGDK
jgi:hypothetical protein